MTQADTTFDRCTRCGSMKSQHWALPLASPGQTVLLCPSALFRSPSEVPEERAADRLLQELMDEP